jgi:hypothetical protein
MTASDRVRVRDAVDVVVRTRLARGVQVERTEDDERVVRLERRLRAKRSYARRQRRAFMAAGLTSKGTVRYCGCHACKARTGRL